MSRAVVSQGVCVRRIRLEPDAVQKRVLDSQSKICCWLYNRLKERADALRVEFARASAADGGQAGEAARIGKTLYTERGLRDLVPAMKKDYPFLRSVHSSPLKNAALRLARAIRAHQDSKTGRRKGGGRIVGWPGFRKWSREYFSLEYDEPGKGFALAGRRLCLTLGVTAEGARLRLDIPLAETAPHPGRIRCLRIVREGGAYFAVVTVTYRSPESKPVRSASAIDPNHKNFGHGVGTDGRSFEIGNMPGLRELDVKIDKVKRKRDRCSRKSQLVEYERQDGSKGRYWKPSRRWAGYDRALKRLEAKRREQTKSFVFSLANVLVRAYDLVAVGDYAPGQGDTGLGRKANRQIKNRSLLGRFKQVVVWVAKRSGKQCVIYDERGTTRACSQCGHVVEGGLAPAIRQWECPDCLAHHDRDENAARNGLERVLRSGSLQLPRSGPAGYRRCDWRYHPTRGWREAAKAGANENENGSPGYGTPIIKIGGVIAPDPDHVQI